MTSDLTFIERTFDKAIVQVLREPTVGYKLMPMNTDFRGLGKETVEYFNYKQRGSAKIAYSFDRNGPDTIDANGTIIKVPILQTQVKIPRRSFQMMVDNGVPLSNDIAFDMIRAINIQVDGLVINGWTEDGVTYESLGMSQIAGTAVTGATVQTFGNTYKAIQKAIAAMVLAGIDAPAYNALMNPVQAGVLKGSLNANSGNPEMAMVLDALNPNGGNTGQFFQRSNVPAGYMIVAPYRWKRRRRISISLRRLLPCITPGLTTGMKIPVMCGSSSIPVSFPGSSTKTLYCKPIRLSRTYLR